MSNYPTGFSRGVIIRGVPITQTQPGKAFWVYNGTAIDVGQKGGSDGNRGTFDAPFATLDYAIGQCTAGRGDIIFIKPGHAETLSAAGAVTADVAGVAIVGLGSGTFRPTFTLDTAATTTISVTAANVSFKNIRFMANFADITAVFTTTTAKELTLEDCFIGATATNMNFLNVVDTNATTNDTDGLYIAGCRWVEPDTATLGFVKMDGTNDRVFFNDNNLTLGVKNNTASFMAIATGKVVTSLQCRNNTLYRLNTDTATGGLLITTDGSTNSGIIANNFAQHADTAAEILVTASSGFGFFENYASGVAGASGYLLPAADS
jgi:hypothetical protein